MSETWRDIEEFAGRYQVSSEGRVRSTAWSDALGRFWAARVMRAASAGCGYLKVSLRLNGQYMQRYVHRLVLKTFRGAPPEGEEGAHRNGKLTDNILANLRWKSHSANEQDKKRHGTSTDGERHPNARLTVSDVKSIRASALSANEEATYRGVTAAHIYAVRSRRYWAHV